MSGQPLFAVVLIALGVISDHALASSGVDQVVIKGDANVVIRQGATDAWSAGLKVDGNTLIVDSVGADVIITIPSLTRIDLFDSARVQLESFDTARLRISMSDASRLTLTGVHADELLVSLHDSALLQAYDQRGSRLTAGIADESRLSMENMRLDSVRLQMSGRSAASLGGSSELAHIELSDCALLNTARVQSQRVYARLADDTRAVVNAMQGVTAVMSAAAQLVQTGSGSQQLVPFPS